MHRCDEIVELTSLYMDGELDEQEQARLKQHIGQCAACARLYHELRAVDSLLRRAPVVAAPESFTERAVAAAFEDATRRNVRFGLFVLALGTLIISSIILLGHVDVLWTVASILFAPGFFASVPLWAAETIEVVEMSLRVALSVLGVLRGLVIGPLLVPSLISLLAAAFVALILRQDSQRTLTTT